MNILLVCLSILYLLFLHSRIIGNVLDSLMKKTHDTLKEIIEDNSLCSRTDDESLKFAKSVNRCVACSFIPIVNLFIPNLFAKKVKNYLTKGSKSVTLSEDDKNSLLKIDNPVSLISALIDVVNDIIDLTPDKQLVPMAYKLKEIIKLSDELELDVTLCNINGMNVAILRNDIDEKTTILLNGYDVELESLSTFNLDRVPFKVYLESRDENIIKKANDIIDEISNNRKEKNKYYHDVSDDITFLETKERKLGKVLR